MLLGRRGNAAPFFSAERLANIVTGRSIHASIAQMTRRERAKYRANFASPYGRFFAAGTALLAKDSAL